MTGHVKGVSRHQVVLLSDRLDDYVDEENPVRFIDAFVNHLNLKEHGFKHSEPEATGRPPYDPSDLLKLYTGTSTRATAAGGWRRSARETWR